MERQSNAPAPRSERRDSSSKRSDFSERLESQGVATYSLKPNRRQELEAILRDIQPTICLFDRFFAEEAYSFVVRDAVPDALRVLDTQDLHFLRNGRHDVLKAATKKGGLKSLRDIVGHVPGADSPALLRELAALYRSDLSIMCSPVEVEMLKLYYGLTPSNVALSSFLCSAAPLAEIPGYAERQHFMTIGNFKHPPNMDSVKWLAGELWPEIRQRLAAIGMEVEMHIYGAYPSQEAMQLNQPKQGLRVLGHAPSLDIMRNYRACLTPLRFGAGLKGKVLDSWAHGLPVCTTPIGAEGLFAEGYPPGGTLDSWLNGDEMSPTRAAIDGGESGGWGGTWAATTSDEIASDAVRMYSDEALWTACQTQGYELLQSLFSAEENKASLYRDIAAAMEGMARNRQGDYVGSMLWHQNNRATEFFSRWVELKERAGEAQPPSGEP